MSNENIRENLEKTHGSEEGIDFKLFNLQQYLNCELIKGNIFKDQKIEKLMNSIKSSSNGEFTESNIKCLPCDETMMGGYSPPGKLVILCKNRLQTEEEVKNTLVHELIHVFDFYRGKLNFNDCESIVCSEIRAANLTEDCSLINELSRLNAPFGNYKERCIKRRSILSAQYTSACLSLKNTQFSYSKVSKNCLQDWEPLENPKNYNI